MTELLPCTTVCVMIIHTKFGLVWNRSCTWWNWSVHSTSGQNGTFIKRLTNRNHAESSREVSKKINGSSMWDHLNLVFFFILFLILEHFKNCTCWTWKHKNLKLFQSITVPKNLVWQTQSVLQQSSFSAWIHYKTKLTILDYFLVRLFFLLGVVQCVSQPITPTCSHPNLQTNLMENQIYVNRLSPPIFL